jgi:hypothetical protein
MSKVVNAQVAGKFSVSASVLSDVMDPKANRNLYDTAGGSVESIASSIGADLKNGLSGDPDDLAARVSYFGGNYFAEKKWDQPIEILPSFFHNRSLLRQTWYLELVWNGLQDTTIMLLIACAFVGLILSFFDDHKGSVMALRKRNCEEKTIAHTFVPILS